MNCCTFLTVLDSCCSFIFGGLVAFVDFGGLLFSFLLNYCVEENGGGEVSV